MVGLLRRQIPQTDKKEMPCTAKRVVGIVVARVSCSSVSGLKVARLFGEAPVHNVVIGQLCVAPAAKLFPITLHYVK